MTVKLCVLKSGEDVIADVKEILTGSAEDNSSKVIGYILNDSYRVKLLPQEENEFKISFFPWIALTEQKSIPIPPDWVVTIVEPIEQLKKLYEEKINGNENNQNTSTTEQSNSDNAD